MRPTIDREGEGDDAAREARFTLDLAWRFTDLSPLAAALLRREPGAVLGKVFWSVFPETVGSTFEHCFREAITTQSVATFEAPSPALTGWFAFRATPGPAGLTVVGSAVDITARRRAEREQGFLNEASAVLASSLDPATTLERVARLAVSLLADYCVIDLFDADGHLRRVTTAHADPARETVAQALREYITRLENPHSKVAVALRTGRPVFEAAIDDTWVPGIAQSPAHLDILRALNPGSLLATPLVARDRTLGALIFFRTRGKEPYHAADLPLAAELAHRSAVALDNARLYHEAREAVDARDRFLSIASHELRTPVAGAKGYAQLLLRRQAHGTLDPVRLVRGLQAIDESADRLDRLTRDLLDVSRLRLDQFPLRRGPLDLTTFTRGVAAQFGDRLDTGHTLAVALPEVPSPIDGDADRLEQVLTNLLENAVKYSPDGGEIRVTLAHEDGGALLRVQDRGIGLPSGSTETIFEPFGRAPNSAARQIPGLGLGLHICREIIDRHGGWIRATSEGEDRGATVAFWLPLVAEPGETEDGHG